MPHEHLVTPQSKPATTHQVRKPQNREGATNPLTLAEVKRLRRLYSKVKDADEIFLIGAGKGKASATSAFIAHLRKYYPEVADRVRRIERVDLESLTEAEILAIGRKMLLRP
jgi:hypothetical protein